MIASSSLRKVEPGDVLLVKEGFPECGCGVWGETGLAVWIFRRLEVADVRLLAPIEAVSLDMPAWLSLGALLPFLGATGVRSVRSGKYSRFTCARIGVSMPSVQLQR